MKAECFAVYDSKAAAYLQPIFVPNEAIALRIFADAVMNPEHAFHKHAEDFVIFSLGSFDDQTGKFDLHASPRSIVGAWTVLANNGETERKREVVK